MRHISLAIILCAIASVAMAQSFTVYEKDKDRAYNVEDVDSIVFSTEPAAPAISEPRTIKGRWCSLGTSISWLNENTASYPLTKGYQTRVMEKLAFTNFSNRAVNGGVLSSAISQVALADYYTIEHGINDWGHSTPVGTIDDYINNTKNGTFAAIYRQLIDRIFSRNRGVRQYHPSNSSLRVVPRGRLLRRMRRPAPARQLELRHRPAPQRRRHADNGQRPDTSLREDTDRGISK